MKWARINASTKEAEEEGRCVDARKGKGDARPKDVVNRPSAIRNTLNMSPMDLAFTVHRVFVFSVSVTNLVVWDATSLFDLRNATFEILHTLCLPTLRATRSATAAQLAGWCAALGVTMEKKIFLLQR